MFAHRGREIESKLVVQSIKAARTLERVTLTDVVMKVDTRMRCLDRFIPSRALIDFDSAYDKLTEETMESELQWEMNASALCRNQKRLEFLRQLGRMGRINERIFPLSILDGLNRAHPYTIRLWPCQPRKKPVIRDEKILDLPDFNCGFHLSPIDWGPNDMLVTSVANKVLIGSKLNQTKVEKETVFEYDSDRCTAASWSPDGKKLAFGSEEGFLFLWYIFKKTTESFCCSERPCTVTVIQWHPDSQIYAWGCTRGKLVVRSIEKKLIVKVGKAHRGYICAMAYSPRGNYLCTSGQDSFLRIWKGEEYRPYMEIEMANPCRAVAWHPWRSGLLAVGEGPPAPGSLSLWNVNTAEMIFMKKLPESTSITALNFNKITGELVFAQCVDDGNGSNQFSQIFVLGGPQNVTDSITNISGTVFALLWNADNTKLGAASSDETFRVWNFLKPVRCKRPYSEMHKDLSFLALKKFNCLIR